jgi:hypothetical protein
MSFAAPLFLVAVLAGLVPVAVHLIHRRKAKEIPFSTLRFLRLSVQKTRRRKYVEDLALLALRAAALVLVAVGLARPTVNGLAALWGGGRGAALAIVLDNSASMATLDGGKPRFEAARQAVEQVLGRVREGDQVALLPTGGPHDQAHGRLFRTHETVRQALESCRVSHERADLAARLQQARDLLAGAEASSKEIYVVTDNQALSWEGLKEDAPGAAALPTKSGSPAEVPVVLVSVDREPAPNVAVQSVVLSAPAPVAGAPFQALVEVLNTATVPQQKHLELRIDGAREAVSPTLALPPGGSLRYAFRFRLDRAGVHRGEVRLAEDDGLPLDNALFFAASVDQPIPVAIVKPRRDEVPQADDAFYLERALAPGGGVGAACRITTLTPDSLAAEDLSRQALIFAVNLPALSPPAAGRLLDYVKAGGRLVWICGQNVDPTAYNSMNALAQGQLLPGPIEAIREPLPGGAERWRVGFVDKDDPALAALTEPASLYQSVLVYKHVPMTLGPQSGARTLIKLDDGQPLLAERPVGNGSVLLLGAALHVDWTNLPLKPIFLPLLARLTFRLAGAEAERTMALAGAPVSLVLARAGAGAQGSAPAPLGQGEVEIVRPSGELVRRPGAGADGLFRYDDTHEVGVYLVRPLNRTSPATLAFAVNIDPAESDSASVTPQELQARFGTRPLLICERPEELTGMIARLRDGTGLRDAFLMAVLAALVLEVFLANRRGLASVPAAIAPAAAAPAPTAGPDPVPGDAVHGFLESLEHAAAVLDETSE